MKQYFLFINSILANGLTLLSLEKNIFTVSARQVNIDQVPARDPDDQVIIVLADQLVSNYELTLAARNQTQLMKAARYAAEEKIPGKLEQYHIVTQKSSKHRVSVRAIQNERFEALLSHLKSYDIEPSELYVESDLINGSIPTLLINAQESTLCGNDLDQTYEFDTKLVPIIGQRIFAAIEGNPDLNIIYPEDLGMVIEAVQNQAPENLRIKKILKDKLYYESLCLNQRSGINLLKGKFSTNENESRQVSMWQYPTWLAAATAFVFTGSLLAQNIISEKKISKEETRLTEQYLQVFPEAKKPRNINDLANKLRGKLSSNASTANSSLPIEPLNLLNSTALASITSPVQIIGLSLDKNTAELLVMGESVEILNAFRTTLQSNIGSDKTLVMDSVISKNEKYQGKISIR